MSDNKRSYAAIPKRILSRNSSSAFANENRKRRAYSGSKADEPIPANVSQRKRMKSEDSHPRNIAQSVKSSEQKLKIDLTNAFEIKKKATTVDQCDSAPSSSSAGDDKTTNQSELSAAMKNKEKSAGKQSTEPQVERTENDTKDSSSVDTAMQGSSSSNQSGFENKHSIKFEVGAKIEALDRLGKWYPAKIVSIDDNDKEVLIHFEKWNSRYDEWVSIHSDRLRHVQRVSRNSPKKSKRSYSVGEIVLARWMDRKMYPAKVTRNDLQGNLTVMFYDGIKKRIKDVYVDKLPPEMENTVIFPPGRTSNKSSLHPEKIAALESASNSASVTHDDRLKKNRLIVGGKFQAKRKLEASNNTTRISPKISPSKEVGTRTKSLAEVAKAPLVEVAVVPDAGKPALVTKSSELSLDESHLMHSSEAFSAADARKVARKEFIIEEDHNHFKCTFDSCGKSFRKAKLLQAHLKHYHGTKGKEDESPVLTKVIPNRLTIRRPSKPSKEAEDGEASPSPVRLTARRPSKSAKDFETAEAHTPPSKVEAEIEKNATVDDDTKTASEPKTVLEPSPQVPTPSKIIQAQKWVTPVSASKQSRKRNKSDSVVGVVSDDTKVEPDGLVKVSDVLAKPKDEVTDLNIRTPKMEISKPNVRSPTKVKSAEIDASKNRTSWESDKSTPVVSHGRTSKRRRLDTAESVSSTVSIDSLSVHSEDCTIVDVERPPMVKTEPGIKKPRSRSRKAARNSLSGVVRDEIVNCSCGLNDENGFMVQCELCLAWQHGVCSSISKEDEVPEKYICSSCISPKLGRESMKYDWDQDWYKKGEMAKFNFLPKSNSDQSSAMLSTHNLAASILSIKSVIHGLKYKLKIAQNKYHPDLDHFKQPWTKDCKPVQETFNLNDASMYGTNMEAIVSAIGALGIPIPTLNQSFNSNSNDPGMLFDPSFFPNSKPHDVAPSVGYYPNTSESIEPSTSTISSNMPASFDSVENKASGDASADTQNVVPSSENPVHFNLTYEENEKSENVNGNSDKSHVNEIPIDSHARCFESISSNEKNLKVDEVPLAPKLEVLADESTVNKAAEKSESSQNIIIKEEMNTDATEKKEDLLNLQESVLPESVTPSKSILDQYIPDIIPSSLPNISSCDSTVSSSLPSDLLDEQTVSMMPQTSASMAQALASNSDFNTSLPIAMSDSELVQGIGLSGNFAEHTLNSSQPQTILTGNEDFINQADMMATLTKEEEEEMIKTLSKPLYPIMPVPREPDLEQYQRNVVDHIEDVQDELEHRLGILETQVEILEMEFDSEPVTKSDSSDNANLSKVKRTIKKFLRDMEKLKTMTEL